MNNIEGWTTIGALVIAAISLVSNHLTNKDNLRSRRENIVKEKSIEAYRSLVQKFLILKFNIINKNISEAIKARNECFYTLIEYRLYLPQKLHDDIGTILRKFMKYTDTNSFEIKEIIDPEEWRQLNNEFNHIVERMQIHLGVEIEEEILENKA